MWKNKKFKRLRKGKYARIASSGERVFELYDLVTTRAYTYESWQAAKRDGWEKVDAK